MAESDSDLDWTEEWQDVAPLPQNDGPRSAVPIAYSADFTRAMGYFRAALARDERSARSLRLTERVIGLNAANYTAWHFRRLCLEALGADSPSQYKFLLEAELDYLDELADENAKNYQLWHHRRWVAQELGSAAADVAGGAADVAARELQFSEQQLREGDSKNYHVWSHRQWVLREMLKGRTWRAEMLFCNRLLEDDVWNNSAWNQRMFALTFLLPASRQAGRTDAGTSPIEDTTSASLPPSSNPSDAQTSQAGIPEEVFDAEVSFTLEAIKKAPANESPWAYLTGLFSASGKSIADSLEILELCQALVHRAGLSANAAQGLSTDGGSLDVATGDVSSAPVAAEAADAAVDAAVPMHVAPSDAVHALALLLELLFSGAQVAAVAHAVGLAPAEVAKSTVGREICDRLQAVDKMRWNYWELRKLTIH